MRHICMYESCDLLILKSLFLRVSLKQLGFASCSIKDKHPASGVIFHKAWLVCVKWVIGSRASMCLSCPYPGQLTSKKMFKVMTLILRREMCFKLNHEPNSIFIIYFSLFQQPYNLGMQLTLQVKVTKSAKVAMYKQLSVVPFFSTSVLFCNFTQTLPVNLPKIKINSQSIRQFLHVQETRYSICLEPEDSKQAHSFILDWIVPTLQWKVA